MNKLKNKYSIYSITQSAILPFCGLMILYCLTSPLISNFAYFRAVQIFLLIICVFFLLSVVFGSLSKRGKDKQRNKTWGILKWIFIVYFVLYLVLFLDTVSVYFNYLMVLLYGIVVGYKLYSKQDKENSANF